MLLPSNVTLRDVQTAAIAEITQGFADLEASLGPATTDTPHVVFWQGPTGVGKTYGAVAAADALGEDKALYVCSGLELQAQFARDFDQARVLKGRSNYTPNGTRSLAVNATCAECDKTGKGEAMACSLCEVPQRCPYTEAKRATLGAKIGVLNTTYLLTEANGPGAFSGRFRFVICDEADELESELMRHLEFRVAARTLAELGMEVPDKGVHRKTMAAFLVQLAGKAWGRANEIDVTNKVDGMPDPAKAKIRTKWKNLGSRAGWMAKQVYEDVWVRDYVEEWEGGSGRRRRTSTPLLYRPVEVSDFGHDLLWRHAPRWLCMSATVISAEQMARDLGLDRDQWRFVESWSTFPPERRPVVTCGVGQMTYKHRAETMPKMIGAVNDIVAHHPGENVLIHTHTYDVTKKMAAGIVTPDERKVWSYANSREREQVVERFRREGGVLCAPSLERGIDLPNDLCRVVIITTVPKPYIKDRQVSERMHREYGAVWYDMLTIRSLVQMVGRGMRHEQDWCITYVLDGAFNVGVWRKRKGLFPVWFREAVEPATIRAVREGDIAADWAERVQRFSTNA